VTTRTSPRPHADTALPPVVSQEQWDAARAELMDVEKAHTRAMDAVAAKRRRLPMVEVDASLELVDERGAATLLDVFEGRRQLVIYHHMLRPNDPSPCGGCSMFIDHTPTHLTHLNALDVTFAVEAAAPIDQLRNYLQRMDRPDIPAWSSSGTGTREAIHPSPHGAGSFGLSVFVRDGERVFRTYATWGRGVDGVPIVDMTVFGRQETFEDSPEGWPQHPTYSFGRLHDEYTPDELAGLAASSTTGETAQR
jgi:predicted dithiol-disulfide oxidoreductase (DUF899 family)